MIAPSHYLWLGGAFFVLGVAGIVTKRDHVRALISIQLIFVAAVINLAAFSQAQGAADGAVCAILVLMISAVDAAIAFAIIGPGGKRNHLPPRLGRPDRSESGAYRRADEPIEAPAAEDAEVPVARP